MRSKFAQRALLTAAALTLSMAAASSALATDPVAKWCGDVKIAAFPGGPQGGVKSAKAAGW